LGVFCSLIISFSFIKFDQFYDTSLSPLHFRITKTLNRPHSTTDWHHFSRQKHQEWKEGQRSGRWWRVTSHVHTLLYEETTRAMPIKNIMCTRHEFWTLVIRNTHCNVAVVAHLSVTLILSLLLYNCPTRCDLLSLLYFCRQLYMFRVLTPIIRSSYNCNYSFSYWLTGSTTIRSRCWVGTDSVPTTGYKPVQHVTVLNTVGNCKQYNIVL
jgi:hypothetical protein